MSKSGRVVAIYHRDTRKVLGHIPCDVITKQTRGSCPRYVLSTPYWPGLPDHITYNVVHSDKGNPIKVIADSQGDATTLIQSQGLTYTERISAMLNEPNPLLEGLEVRV